MKPKSNTLRFEDGAVQFRQRLIVSILSHRPLLIRNIRENDIEAPGLRTYEASFLRLLDALTNGTRIEINSTGTQLRFVPGVLIGGSHEHDCPAPEAGEADGNDANGYRSVGWFLEGILPLAPFGKEPLSLHLTGTTDGCCESDPSVDYFRESALTLLSQFGVGAEEFDQDAFSPQAPRIQVHRRGAAPTGGGSVELYCPIIQSLKPIDYTDPGKFKRVRGTAITCKIVSSSMAARVAFATKGLLHRLMPDVWIHTDAHTIKHHRCGPSPGLSLVLSAESTTGVRMTAECCLNYKADRELPEDLGKRGAAMLLEEIRRGGCVDTGLQSLALLWMCLTPEDVSRIRLGTLTPYTVASLRLFREALGVEFKVKADQDTRTVLLSCLGTGYRNMARSAT